MNSSPARAVPSGWHRHQRVVDRLIVLLDFCFPVHHLESGQKLDKSRIFRELCRDPAGIFLVVQFAALGDDGCRRRKVLRTVLLRRAWQSRSDFPGPLLHENNHSPAGDPCRLPTAPRDAARHQHLPQQEGFGLMSRKSSRHVDHRNALDGRACRGRQCWLWLRRGPASAPKLRQNRFKYSSTDMIW